MRIDDVSRFLMFHERIPIMKMMSAVYWLAGLHNVANRHSVLLKNMELAGDSFVLALLCSGADSSSGEAASGYVAEEMEKWHQQNHLLIMLRNKPLRWIKRSLASTLKTVHGDLVQHGKKQEIFLGVSFVLCAVWREKYVIMHMGEVEALQFGRFREKNLEKRPKKQPGPLDLLGASDFKALKFRYGRVKRGQGMLICSGNMINQLSKGRVFEVFKPSEFRNESQIARRLASLADYIRRRDGGADCAAIYMRFGR